MSVFCRLGPCIVGVSLFLCGCGADQSPNASDSAENSLPSITFSDSVESNTNLTDEQLFDIVFADRFGNEVDLKDYRGKKNVVLVVTRGYSGGFCPFCSAQVSRLIRNHDEFVQRNAELLVVFPGSAELTEGFVEQLPDIDSTDDDPIPFSILLDEGLAVVDKLMIRGNLAKPSTYILDKAGVPRFAYVGSTPSDRPSMKAILDQLDKIEHD